jgi:hypothetical protein
MSWVPACSDTVVAAGKVNVNPGVVEPASNWYVTVAGLLKVSWAGKTKV